MLYAGCCSCGSIIPLWCAGRFMPHMPVLTEPSPYGPYCGFCGALPPIFTCGVCGTTQALFAPGMAAPPSPEMPVGSMVQASQNASEHEVRDKVLDIVASIAKVAAQHSSSPDPAASYQYPS